MKAFERLLETIRVNASSPCVECEDRIYAYHHLMEEIEKWQRRIDQSEVAPGAVIGLRADYSLYAVAALLALMSRHFIVALIPRDGETFGYLDDSHARVLIDMDVNGQYERHVTSCTTSH